jgi:hypothetical protein
MMVLFLQALSLLHEAVSANQFLSDCDQKGD